MPSREWRLRPQPQPSTQLEAVVGDPLLARLLAQRGFQDPLAARAFLDPADYRPSPPDDMPGIADAAFVLRDAIAAGKRFLVWGDFDADGQTSTALLVTLLRQFAGEEAVSFHVPLRSDGHGIRVERLRQLLETSPADLILTCDTGIAEAEAVTWARSAGLSVVVTDHHELPAELRSLAPRAGEMWGLPVSAGAAPTVCVADVIVNPHFCPPSHPLATLPGVGVAWLLAQQLLAHFDRAQTAAPLLDLVALGIVADVARQVDDARYLVQLGLEQLRRTERPGLLALMEFASLSPATATSESIGFQIGPRLNSVGRLSDANEAVELLTTQDPMRARTLAAKIDRLNRERRVLTSEAMTLALEMIDHRPHLLDAEVLVLDRPDWNPGVLGLVAGRLVEEFQKPAAVILAPPGDMARGSARSTPAIHIGDAIAACSNLLTSHGGHAGAAGFALEARNLESFRRMLPEQAARHTIPGADAAEAIHVDSELAWEEVTLETAESVGRLAPFGLGNPSPIFMCRDLTLMEDLRFGQDGSHRRLVLRDDAGNTGSLTWFFGADGELPVGALDVAFTLGVNEYKGTRTVQPYFVAARSASPPPQTILADRLPEPITLVDLRSEATPLDHLPQGATWYAEGRHLDGRDGVPFSPRHHLIGVKSDHLVLWSAPPSAALLDWLVDTVSPRHLYLVGRPGGSDTLESLLTDVAAMCKFAMANSRPAQLGRMAARIGAAESLVRMALLYLDAHRVIHLEEWLAGDEVRIGAAHGAPSPAAMATCDPREIEAALREQHAEMRAFQRFFCSARPDRLGIHTQPATP